MRLISLAYNDSFRLVIDGDEVNITLLQNNDDPQAYAFGIEAPRSLAINREEIYLKKREQHDNSREEG